MEIYIDNQMWRGVVAAFSTGVIIFTGLMLALRAFLGSNTYGPPRVFRE